MKALLGALAAIAITTSAYAEEPIPLCYIKDKEITCMGVHLSDFHAHWEANRGGGIVGFTLTYNPAEANWINNADALSELHERDGRQPYLPAILNGKQIVIQDRDPQ